MRHAIPMLSRSRGALAVTAVVMVLVTLGMLGMSLDLARVYNRRLELDAVANTAALVAAQQLNGTATGIDNAVAAAADVVAGLRYQYHRERFAWSDDMLSFGATRDGDWSGAAAARANATPILFVRADTSRLGAAGSISLMLMRALTGVTSTPVVATAVAGRSGIDVAPLAVCAMSASAAAPRVNPGPPATVELVEYGFRRGVAYDLMQLNPDGITAENFVISPFAAPGAPGTLAGTLPAAVGPYACSGQLAINRISGGALTVARPFPLADLVAQLNSRFNQYVGAQCTYATAPPDRNIKSYPRDSSTMWLETTPEQQGALIITTGGKRWTAADPLPAPASNLARTYGPLWAYAKPVPFSAWTAGVDEPATGYTPYATSDWASLYAPGVPVAKNYPGAPPYAATSGNYFTPSPTSVKGVANRRVLNVALLDCPVAAGSTTATVRGIGKFLMTVPATDTSLYAEFGGLVPEYALGGPVELYR